MNIDERLDGLCIDGERMPWYTTSATDFLAARVSSDDRVFEWGCGSSTVWWANRAGSVVSIDHDQGWRDAVAALDPRVEVRWVEGQAYERTVLEYDPFDVVVVDGRRREMCAPFALKSVKDDGIIVWDNSDRDQYKPSFDLLISGGMIRKDFPGRGFVRNNPMQWCTSVFYCSGSRWAR